MFFGGVQIAFRVVFGQFVGDLGLFKEVSGRKTPSKNLEKCWLKAFKVVRGWTGRRTTAGEGADIFVLIGVCFSLEAFKVFYVLFKAFKSLLKVLKRAIPPRTSPGAKIKNNYIREKIENQVR